MNDDFSFSGLTPDVILDALESIGVYASSGLLALNSYENRVYQFIADDGKRYVVKFYRPGRWSNQAIEEEHTFSAELIEQDIPLAAPLTIHNNTLHHWNQYRFTLFPSVGGRQFENDDLDQLEWMGRFIGRIHSVGKVKVFEHRPTISTANYLSHSKSVLENCELLPHHLQTAFWAIMDPVIQTTEARFNDQKWQSLRLHGDCHPGNILWRDGPTFVDLDDARNGPAIQDLWMMLSGDRANRLLQLDVLLEAYEEFQHFDSKEIRLIEPLRAMRMVHHMAWIALRWQDPAFPRAFPWFAQDKYWEGQILALKEQLAALDEPPLTRV
ncbi:serine/threonine protein kinase [Alteromonas sediminis]|uniref:Stress response kinase A n=1 Tax=Alteromonas sediminis TaxID=2259342 RepID=A0A3N5XZ47_9ALTE|nr:serine/threonine protein kinase [Alteromonas sediminis]RPJ65990.1 serine/threonine protein kinase [Alteromonas sediminis]